MSGFKVVKKEVENMFCFHPVFLFDQFFLVHYLVIYMFIYLLALVLMETKKEIRFFEIAYKKTDK